MWQVDLPSICGISLSKRPSYTACLGTWKGVYQNWAFGSIWLISSGLMQDCKKVMAMGGVGNVTNRGTFGFFLVFYTFGPKATPAKPSTLKARFFCLKSAVFGQ